MTRHKTRTMDIHKLSFMLVWRQLRKIMKDPVELAWRLNPLAKWDVHASRVPFIRAAHTSMYEREMDRARAQGGAYRLPVSKR